MLNLGKIYLFRITHIDNLEHILKFGITSVGSPNKNPNYKSIGDSSLIQSRKAIILPNGLGLSDCIPFYFGARMPMLYVIQHGFNGVPVMPARNIVYCISTIEAMLQNQVGFYFTNGHARSFITRKYGEDMLADFESLVDMGAVKATDWTLDPDLKRRKEAEFLALSDIPPIAVKGVAVYDKWARALVQEFAGMEEKHLLVRPEYYF